MNLKSQFSSTYLMDIVRLLLIKEKDFNPIKYNFHDIRLNPFIFMAFNFMNDIPIRQSYLKLILNSYLKVNVDVFEKIELTDEMIYVPNKGYFSCKQKKAELRFIEGTHIELLDYHQSLIDYVFFDSFKAKRYPDVFILGKALNDLHLEKITFALSLIKKHLVEHFSLIHCHCSMIVLFSTNPSITNSFATINAHGAVFLNVYQEECSEIFFVDDIAHQTGHVILTATTANRKGSFIIDETLQLSILLNDVTEYRSFYTLFHALYTYYTITLCLDKILKSKVLSIAMEKEAIGRIGFYMLKFEADLQQFNKVIMHFTSIEFALTFLGIEIFQL
jgi:hypothetical protein